MLATPAASEAVTRYLSRSDAATYAGVSLRTVDALLADGEVPAIRIGARVLIDRTDLDSFLASRKSSGG